MESSFAELSIDLLVGMRDVLLIDQKVPFIMRTTIHSGLASVAVRYKLN